MTFAEKIDLLASRHPLSVTSWWRTPSRNARVGGATNSLHLVGRAVDVVLDDPKTAENFAADATALGLHAILESDHIHLQAPRDGA